MECETLETEPVTSTEYLLAGDIDDNENTSKCNRTGAM